MNDSPNGLRPDDEQKGKKASEIPLPYILLLIGMAMVAAGVSGTEQGPEVLKFLPSNEIARSVWTFFGWTWISTTILAFLAPRPLRLIRIVFAGIPVVLLTFLAWLWPIHKWPLPPSSQLLYEDFQKTNESEAKTERAKWGGSTRSEIDMNKKVFSINDDEPPGVLFIGKPVSRNLLLLFKARLAEYQPKLVWAIQEHKKWYIPWAEVYYNFELDFGQEGKPTSLYAPGLTQTGGKIPDLQSPYSGETLIIQLRETYNSENGHCDFDYKFKPSLPAELGLQMDPSHLDNATREHIKYSYEYFNSLSALSAQPGWFGEVKLETDNKCLLAGKFGFVGPTDLDVVCAYENLNDEDPEDLQACTEFNPK